MDGIALIKRMVPDLLIHRYELHDRLVKRSGCLEDEIHFLNRSRMKMLPVWRNGELQILEWGARGVTRLPRSLFCLKEHLEAGIWSPYRPEHVEIPATYGLDNGVWYLVPDGAIQGVVVSDRTAHVYILTGQSTVYYENMTRNKREPLFAGEQI